jgi:sterol desaturase/sphingolipid hydroxylase (fatty acid hydroxylase superfamily)
MATSPQNAYMAIAYWVVIYAVTTLPIFIRNYHANLMLLTVIIPNMFRLMVNRIPRLAVDRSFFFISTLVTLIITYLATNWWPRMKQNISEYGKDVKRNLQISALLAAIFALSGVFAYVVGLDKSIYSNLGWES